MDQETAEAKLKLSEAKRRISAESEQHLKDFSRQVQEHEADAKRQMQEESR